MSADSSILRSLGLMLQKEESSSARRPMPVDGGAQRSAGPTLTWVCAWCQRERSEVPLPDQSHGICERHAEVMRRDIQERLRVKLAA